MLKMSRRKLVLLVTLSVFCNAANCIAAEGGSRWLVSPKLLEHADLEILWDNKLPIKSPENLERLLILGNRIYALSDRNYMAALNREKGNVIFGRPIAQAGFPVLGLELYKDELFSIIGNKLVEINPEFGTELGAKRLAFGSVCPAARNSSHFYLGGVDRRMHALRAEDKVQVFEAAAENDSTITSIVADENLVVFTTDAGNVICITPDRTRQLWQFEAAGGIAPPIVRDARSLFLASKDTNIYRINARTGKLVWKYQTAAMLDRGPRVTQDVVYQYVRDEGLVAIDRGSGQLIWQWDEGIDLLAEANDKTYLITNNGKLVVMDNKKAKQLYSVNFAGVSRHAANVSDSKIYIADKTGRIACLKPIK
jgi:outer membrane protein assembly factor BamB